MSNTSAWQGNWEQRLFEGLQCHGFGNDAIAFARAHPSQTYKELVETIDNSLAPIQLIYLLTEQSQASQEVLWFAKDSLVRRVREICLEGWKVGEKGEFRAVSAFVSWEYAMERFEEDVSNITYIVQERLVKSSIASIGWFPKSIDDLVIQEVFSGL